MTAPARQLGELPELLRRVLLVIAANDQAGNRHGLSSVQIGYAGVDARLRDVGTALDLLLGAGLICRYRDRDKGSNRYTRRHRLTDHGRTAVQLMDTAAEGAPDA